MKKNNPKTFEDFKKLATDENLKPHEKVDFPARHTGVQIEAILEDWKGKLPGLFEPKKVVLDLGCGCQLVDNLWLKMSEQSKLLLVDSKEMLANVDDYDNAEKYPGKFPKVPKLFKKYTNKVDIIIANSVAQYVFAESENLLFDFIYSALYLLKSGGKFLLSDIPNFSKAQRFFNSKKGKAYHREHNKTNKPPVIKWTGIDICDEVMKNIVATFRSEGYDVYMLPQNENLLMSNRREDLLFCKN